MSYSSFPATKIDVNSAKIIAKCRLIHLSKLKMLDLESAKSLINQNVKNLHLNWITRLDSDIFDTLMDFSWFLNLSWLTNIFLDLAKKLRNYKWQNLWLDWIKNITPEIANEFKHDNQSMVLT